MASTARTVPRPTTILVAWLPRQHGAWAMLAVPLLLGVAASRPSGWQLVLAATAVAGYLAAASAQGFLRSRGGGRYRAPLIVYGGAFGALGLLLAWTHPILFAALVVLVPAAGTALWGARPGTRRAITTSLAAVVQALVLVPAAAVLAGPTHWLAVERATLLAAIYLAGTVLVVRSVIRERGNGGFAALSVGYHLGAVVVAALLLPWAYVAYVAALAVRAASLPVLQRRWAGSGRPLRPIQVGVVEIVASAALVALAFTVSL